MILVIDNYDSFSYNLVQELGAILMGKEEIEVVRNDESSVAEIKAKDPSHIILSPGPGRPENAGICEEVIRACEKICPILGVCLGHQAICQVYGAEITYAPNLMHGKQSIAMLKREGRLFDGVEKKIKVARYHSLVAKRDTIPEVLEVMAETEDGMVMAVRHKKYQIYGLQFHPESVLTPDGRRILENFLSVSREEEE